MEHLGINVEVRNIPELDKEFIPLYLFNRAFLKDAKKPVGVAVERANGEVAAVETFIHGTEAAPRGGLLLHKPPGEDSAVDEGAASRYTSVVTRAYTNT